MSKSNLVEPIRKKTEINKVTNALHGRNRVLFVLGINLGLRVSDLIALKVSDLFDENMKPRKGTLTIREGKTGKPRRFVLNDKVKRELKKAGYTSEDVWLFPSRKGSSHIGREAAWKIVKEAVDRAGLEGNFGTHTLRKTFGYHAYKAGISVDVLQKTFSHSSSSITLRYIGITQEDINDVYMSVNL